MVGALPGTSWNHGFDQRLALTKIEKELTLRKNIYFSAISGFGNFPSESGGKSLYESPYDHQGRISAHASFPGSGWGGTRVRLSTIKKPTACKLCPQLKYTCPTSWKTILTCLYISSTDVLHEVSKTHGAIATSRKILSRKVNCATGVWVYCFLTGDANAR